MSRILIIVLFFPAIFANVPKVTLSHGGILVGNYTKTINGRQISAFKGIPYAQPPLGNLRFKSPQPFPAWQGERNAINESSVCFQVEAGIRGTTPAGQEDCLYLNVYVPTHVHRKKKPLPVMVWFHGGGWIYGSGGEEFGGPQYLLDKDVILVAGNYRLNIFGFLSSETLDCPGNFGLKDQAEILKWINKHIASFGGNPNSVTIFGESSGAVSVMYLMHSAQCNKLFHRAIAQSGTEFNTFGHPHRKGKAAERAMQLARQVNCDKNEGNWKEIIDCLREVPGDTLIRQFHKYYEWEFFPTIPLSAVIEENHPDAFITMDPRISPVPQNIALIVGFTSEEGAIYSAPILNSETMLRQLKENYTNLMPLMLYYDHLEKSRQDEVTSKIIEYYLKNGHDYSPDNFENFTQIITDGMFFVGFDQLVRRRVSQSSPKTYAYVFNHRGAKSITSILGGGSRYYGVSHADELQYIFTWDKILNITESNFRDEAMRDAMVELWTNFVIHGDPTPRGCKYHNWKSVDGFLWNYARIGSNNTEERRMIWNERELVKDRIDFWNSLRIF